MIFFFLKSKYKSRYSEAFLNAVHDPPVTSINSTRRTIRLLNLLLSCDRPLVCSEVTGFLWLWAWSYDSSEVDGSNWKHRTALYEKDLGQVGLFSLFMYFFSFSSPPPTNSDEINLRHLWWVTFKSWNKKLLFINTRMLTLSPSDSCYG